MVFIGFCSPEIWGVFLTVKNNNCKMVLIKTSEKLLVWMYRNNMTQQQISKEMDITRQTLAQKMKDNVFSVGDIMNLKRIGFNE